MAVRTNSPAVILLLQDDYGLKADGSAPDLTPRMDTATVIVDRVVTAAAAKGVTFTAAELELMERWLAAHLYTLSDPTYTSRSTGGASGSFARNAKTPEPYKDGALSVDYSGCLNAILNQQRAGGFWAGQTEGQRTDWIDRVGP